MLRNISLLRRQLSTSGAQLQQFATRPTFRTFPAENESVEQEEMSDTPRFQRTFTPRPTQPTETKAAINPFPEEVGQDYTSALYQGAAEKAFPNEVTEILQAPLAAEDVEIKPDGAVYLPENRYRKILGKAFGPGGWCLMPRGAHSLANGVLSREYALFCEGRFISQVRGHASIMGFSNPAMASEVVRSNALMRACKDLGIGNELWDPAFTLGWKSQYATRRTDANGKPRWVKNSGQAQYS